MMSANNIAKDFEEISHPLDLVEYMVGSLDWTCERLDDNRLSVQIQGAYDVYSMSLEWQEYHNALQIHCELDLVIPEQHVLVVHAVMGRMNVQSWMGFFVLDEITNMPLYRHTNLIDTGEEGRMSDDHIAQIMNEAITACERAYTALSLFCNEHRPDADTVSLALSAVNGEA